MRKRCSTPTARVVSVTSATYSQRTHLILHLAMFRLPLNRVVGYAYIVFAVNALLVFVICSVPEMVVRAGSVPLICTCNSSAIETRRMVEEHGAIIDQWRAVWNVTECTFKNGTAYPLSLAYLTIGYNPESWMDCNTEECAKGMLDKCPLGNRRPVYYSEAHTLGYIKKHWSASVIAAWSWAGVVFSIQLIYLVLALMQRYVTCPCRSRYQRL